MFERFTKDARTIVTDAQEQARALGSERIGPAHLLLAVLDQHGPEARAVEGAGLARGTLVAAVGAGRLDADALATLGVDLEQVRRRADELFGTGALESAHRPSGRIPFSPEAKKTLELALREAVHLGDKEITTAHLVLGLTRPSTVGAELVRRCGAEPDDVRHAVLAQRAD